MDIKLLYQTPFKIVNPLAQIPTYATKGSAAADVCSCEEYVLKPNERKLFKLGFCCAVHDGHALLVCSRSGMTLKHGIVVANQPGIIDSDYRDEVGVILWNTSEVPFKVERGMRIAQLLLVAANPMGIMTVSELDQTDRTGGFGSTGVK